MNNCFINSVLKALNNLDKFNQFTYNINDELINNIKYNNSINVNKIVFETRTNNTQEDAEEFLSYKLLPKFNNYKYTNEIINLSNEELNIINEFIQYNKSKIFEFLKKYNYFDNNRKYYKYFYDFYDNIKNINNKKYIRHLTLSDHFTNYYIDLNNNELVKSFTIMINNNNIKNILQKIFFLKINTFIIFNINYVDNTNFIIQNNINTEKLRYNLKRNRKMIIYNLNQIII